MPRNTQQVRRDILVAVASGLSFPTHLLRRVGLNTPVLRTHLDFLVENGFLTCETTIKAIKRWDSTDPPFGKLSDKARTRTIRRYFITDKGRKVLSEDISLV